MRRFLSALKQEREGATAIEFAMVAPVLFVFICGIFEFGMVLVTQSVIEGSAQTISRVWKASANTGSPTGQTFADSLNQKVVAAGGGLIKPTQLRVVVSPLGAWGSAGMETNPLAIAGAYGSGAAAPGRIFEYEVYYNYQVFTPFIRPLIGTNGILRLRAFAASQIEPGA